MAGKPGRSGGARPGAGRPRKAPAQIDAPSIPILISDPKAFLTAVMNDGATDTKVRVDAAKALMPFIHPKLGEGGKKEQKDDAAKKAGAGRFGASAPPKLVVNNGK